MEKNKKYLTQKASNSFRWMVILGDIIYGFIGWLCCYVKSDNNWLDVLGVALIAFAIIQVICIFTSKRISKTKFIVLSILTVVPLILLMIAGDDVLLLSDMEDSELCEICPKCGNEITSKQNYCSYCGYNKKQ